MGNACFRRVFPLFSIPTYLRIDVLVLSLFFFSRLCWYVDVLRMFTHGSNPCRVCRTLSVSCGQDVVSVRTSSSHSHVSSPIFSSLVSCPTSPSQVPVQDICTDYDKEEKQTYLGTTIPIQTALNSNSHESWTQMRNYPSKVP